ncbi:type III pantothenate kinase [Thermocrinis minervae]|uniref:type III pantothenate kinase n=1 Tax=Thermocrinis minervae TaxID=381751 RepID=UPI001E3CFE62|nr:type III pantothenate kinase [Thermocrinis minervae]
MGNTTIDACSFEKGELSYLGKFSHDQIHELKGSWERVYISSVRPSLNRFLEETFKNAFFIRPEHVPIETEGIQKQKVGIDRLLNLYGAFLHYGKDCLVVSCGTAMVLDLIVEGIFVGGFITLGLSGKLRCLQEKAELIPSFQMEKVDVPVGKDTRSAILGGIIREARVFILSFLEESKRTYGKEIRLVITGGDGYLLEDLGIYDPILIFRGMVKVAGAGFEPATFGL